MSARNVSRVSSTTSTFFSGSQTIAFPSPRFRPPLHRAHEVREHGRDLLRHQPGIQDPHQDNRVLHPCQPPPAVKIPGGYHRDKRALLAVRTQGVNLYSQIVAMSLSVLQIAPIDTAPVWDSGHKKYRNREHEIREAFGLKPPQGMWQCSALPLKDTRSSAHL